MTVKKERPSFLKKRSKRLSFVGEDLSPEEGASRSKVFWFFFSKKNCFPRSQYD
jgi:hypothetical protein